MLRKCKHHTAFCFLLSAFCFLPALSVLAQQPNANATGGAIQLPEVVITGIDQSKFQRLLPTVSLPTNLPVIAESAWDRSEALTHKGDGYFLTQFRQAEQQYTQAIAQDSGNSLAYLRLGDVYRALNKYVDAANAYQQALAHNPNLLEAHYKLGLLYETQLQDVQKAIEYYQAYIQLGGDDPRIKIWLRDLERQTVERQE